MRLASVLPSPEYSKERKCTVLLLMDVTGAGTEKIVQYFIIFTYSIPFTTISAACLKISGLKVVIRNHGCLS